MKRTPMRATKKVGTKAAKAKADTLFSLIIRAEMVCQMCGYRCPCPEAPRKHTTSCSLTCSHFVGRTANWTRTYEDNATCLCRPCHGKVEGNPPLHVEWFRGLRGDAVVTDCRVRGERTTLAKFNWPVELERLTARAVELGIVTPKETP